MRIQFYWLKPYHLKSRKSLKSFIESIFKEESKKLESVNFIFCDDNYLLKINQDYLDHNSLTDIISFEMNEPGFPVVGEIYISIDRVAENASHYGVSVHNELLRVIFHGLLHFCGYKDKKQRDIRIMRERENYYLQKYMFHVEQ